ncbi:23S rRNA (pseudouridine(1915)-N(3))-methyltransferase RlmH [Shimazuella sp. AN120528]|uniref:23S rRNA (pseudouridine(1915)-N(3))-methyltransferase RlmH n=1 Tax=Shimazuella soli TaxID=1892854 RepID=UPI001F0DCF68|nr:23S rRNA (pseudouridine(1915)-N(3))-methyltransferase RlmH [Shimazuella soli]MCH5585074.1 23S rRNA (pseudouridine(1915)-N(3))-methyltransferase RlmH [Shimazuella soli]
MQINLIAVGNLKEKYLKDACAEYQKRLQAYAKLNLFEVEEENKGSVTTRKQKEGEKIIKKISNDTFVIVLSIDGKSLSSEQFAEKINHLGTYGNSHLTFIIGGSDGLSSEVIQKANLQLSFSKMTFPHQLMRVFLLEQIYRGFKIIRGESYHK